MEANTESKIMRVALIGKTGCGKSALGNTLLCAKRFKSSPAGESVTIECDASEGVLPSGRRFKVVDTPGILDTRDERIGLEVTKTIGHLSPGPHAFIIVLQPNRATKEERQVLTEITDLFGDSHFLEYTLIVMVRKNEIVDDDDNPIDIHDFIEQMAADDVKALYDKCNQRIIAVDNFGDKYKKIEYAEAVADKVSSMDGYYSHDYFKLRQEYKLGENQIAELKTALSKKAAEKGRAFCSIL